MALSIPHLLLYDKKFNVLCCCSYLFNLVGQCFGFHALQDQCSHIISMLLESFKSNPSKEIIGVLGEQLQVSNFYYIALSFSVSN